MDALIIVYSAWPQLLLHFKYMYVQCHVFEGEIGLGTRQSQLAHIYRSQGTSIYAMTSLHACVNRTARVISKFPYNREPACRECRCIL